MRSPGTSVIARRFSGRSSSPPSLAIWIIGRRPPSTSRYSRAFEAFSSRSRYSRRRTRMRGATAPLTRIVSPRKPGSGLDA